MELLYQVLFALILATALAGLAYWRDALTTGGLELAWALAVVIGICGGLAGFCALAATLIFALLAGKLSKRVREPLERQLHARTGPRNAAQIFCNVFVGTAMLLLRAITGRDCFLWAYGGAMAASLADSMASELGVLSKRPPRDILNLRPVQKGLSGGVTPLGLGASLLGAAIIAAICAALWGGGYTMFFDVTAAGFFAALCDSILGSAFQAKYRCGVCGALTEKPYHCGVDGTVERGFRFVDNNVVNFCNNLIGAGAALALFYL